MNKFNDVYHKIKLDINAGQIIKANRQGELYNCSCGLLIDADTNAAINILHRGVYSPSNQQI